MGDGAPLRGPPHFYANLGSQGDDMTTIVAKRAVDMTAWDTDFADSTGAIIGTHDANAAQFTGTTHTFDFTGKHFNYVGDVPASGKVETLTISTGAQVDVAITAAQDDFDVVFGFFDSGDWTGMQELLFAEQDSFVGSKKNDHFKGFAGDDNFAMTKGGNDTVEGGQGNDIFDFGAAFTRNDQVAGGSGADTVMLDGDYISVTVLETTSLAGVETIKLATGNSYVFQLVDGNIGPGGLTVDGTGLALGDSMEFFLDESMTAAVTMLGGADHDNLFGAKGADTLSASGGGDYIRGAGGADTLTGGGGADSFDYRSARDSTGTAFDTITDFKSGTDQIALTYTIDAVDTPVVTGSASLATLNADIEDAVDASQLHAERALLFTPDGGDFDGQTFIVIDRNGTAGYQAGKDFLILMGAQAEPEGLSASDFFTPA